MLIRIDDLKAALVCAAKKGQRFYLCGVAVDGKYVVGTDAYVLYAAEQTGEENDLCYDEPIVIDRSQLETALKQCDRKQALVSVERHDEKTIKVGDCYCRLIGERYPDWRRILPKKVGDGPLLLGFEIVQKMEKVCKIKGLNYCSIQFSADAGQAVLYTGQCIFVGMQMRHKVEACNIHFAKREG